MKEQELCWFGMMIADRRQHKAASGQVARTYWGTTVLMLNVPPAATQTKPKQNRALENAATAHVTLIVATENGQCSEVGTFHEKVIG